MRRLRVLFVCSRNQWRSPTAERQWRRSSVVDARSAGTSDKARRRVRESDLQWADLVLVMEHKHRQRLQARFRQTAHRVPIEVLAIPDDYRFEDPALIALLDDLVPPILERYRA